MLATVGWHPPKASRTVTMRSRLDPEDGLASRGVYEQPFLVKGCREFVAVSSLGELIAARLVKPGRSPARAEGELWEELDEHDPVQAHLTPPSLRLVT